MRRSWPIALLVLSGFAPAARAAEVHTVPMRDCGRGGCVEWNAAVYTAAPGEHNEVSLAVERDARVFRDRVPIATGLGCAARADGAVVCDATEARIDLGDGDDTARGDGRLSVEAGTGNDVVEGAGSAEGGPGDDQLAGRQLNGGEGSDVLTGTAELDRLAGGPGADRLTGGDGDDQLSGDGASDVIDGGRGRDHISYIGYEVPVRVDLTAGTGGADGEDDRLTGIEDVAGGDGGSVLVGDGGPNFLYAGRGRNTIVGAGGNDDLMTGGPGVLRGGSGDDMLTGTVGADRLFGGAGDDNLSGGARSDLFSGGAGDDRVLLHGSRLWEKVGCGPGRDVVVWAGLALLPPDCETTEGSPVYPRVEAGGRLAFTLNRMRGVREGRLELRVRGRTRRFAVARFAGGTRTVRVVATVPRQILRLRRSPLPIEVRVDARDLEPRRWVFDLRR